MRNSDCKGVHQRHQGNALRSSLRVICTLAIKSTISEEKMMKMFNKFSFLGFLYKGAVSLLTLESTYV